MVKVAIIGKGKFGSKIENCINAYMVSTDKVEFVEPDNADWIIIATPNDLHHEQVEYWLSQKKNVFCEKPLTLTKRSAEALFSLADFFGVKLYVDDVFYWNDTLDFVDYKGHVEFKWYKNGSFNANIIDNLAYHHFYLWLGSEDFEIKEIYAQHYNSVGMCVTVTLEDLSARELLPASVSTSGRTATFDYDILRINEDIVHTIQDDWDTTNVNSDSNPLKDMLESVLLDFVKNPPNRGPGKSFRGNKQRTLNAIKLCEAVKKEILPKVLVVGGGIFGTTASVALATSGFNVTLHEELDHVIMAASDINQYRLHKGYHYPRSKETAQECLGGMKSFKRKYGASVVNGDVNHFYAISSRDSLVSREQYLEFLDDMELDYNLYEPFFGTNLTIEADEELFDSDKLRVQVIQKMKGAGVNVICGKHTTKEDFDDYDYVVIATYSKLNELLDDKKQYQFEVVEKPVVKLPEWYKDKSVVVMDGPFMCFDPYKDGNHVLGHVEHAIHSTNVGHYPMVLNKYIAAYMNNGIIHNPHITKIHKFIEAGMEFFEDFDKLEHIGSMFTVRTVLAHRDHDDARPTLVIKENDKVYTIFSGKIGTCVQAANELVEELRK